MKIISKKVLARHEIFVEQILINFRRNFNKEFEGVYLIKMNLVQTRQANQNIGGN